MSSFETKRPGTAAVPCNRWRVKCTHKRHEQGRRQFIEIPHNVVFTVEYSVRAAQMAVYQLLGIARQVPPVTPHAKSLETQIGAVLKAFK